jgi:hypothetical protein
MTRANFIFLASRSRHSLSFPRWAHGNRHANHQSASRIGVVLQGMASGSRAPDADEQPRSRRRRASRRSHRLRRLGKGGARLAQLRRDRRVAPRARARRDAARAVGQTGRRLPHAHRRAARPHRQRPARPCLGHVGNLPRSRAPRAHDVRPDDRRELDLHRISRDFAGYVRAAAPSSPPVSAAWAARSRSPRR